MKFSLKNLGVTFGGWELSFKRIKEGAYAKYTAKAIDLPKEAFSFEDGEVKFDASSLNTNQLLEFSELEERFLAEHLVEAKADGEECETQEQKELLVNYLLTLDEFAEWKEGYLNGPKQI
jgi:hypothetical protein